MGNILSECIKCNKNDPENQRPKKEKNSITIKNNTTNHQSNGTNSLPNENPIELTESEYKQQQMDIWIAKLQARMEERLKEPLDLYYKMNHKNRGLCLIFNHEKFIDMGLGQRKGTQVDRDRLLKTFTDLDFDVRIFDNPGEMEIRAVLKKVGGMDHTQNDCLVVIVLSHGELVPYYDYHSGDESNTLLSHDLMSYVHSKDSMYPLQMIWSYFTDENCPSLVNKPRIFLIQACQGNQTDPGIRLISRRNLKTESDCAGEDLDSIPIEKVRTIQPMAQRALSIDETDGQPYEPIKIKPILPQKDFLIAYASLPGFFSFRNTLHGAWFIQSLCKELNERDEHYDLIKILTLTCQNVAYDFESHSYDIDLDLKKQIPCVSSMLTKLLIFPKKEYIKNGF